MPQRNSECEHLKTYCKCKWVTGSKNRNSCKRTSSVYPDQQSKVNYIYCKADSSLNFPVEIELSNNISNDLKAVYGTAYSNPQQKTKYDCDKKCFVKA
jgi:hypothetical protein